MTIVPQGSQSRMKLLVVAYHFMKTQSAGGHRLQAMVKYLSRLGWDATVVTVGRDDTSAGEQLGKTVLAYPSRETRVIRTRSFEMSWIWTVRQRRGMAGDSHVSLHAGNAAGSNVERRPGLSESWKAPARWFRTILAFPDRQVGWYLPLSATACKLLRRSKFDVVLTSGPPHSCHLPFVFLRKFHRFLWVCDFRDPWTDPPFYAVNKTTLKTQKVRYFLNRVLEEAVLRTCDRVLANTRGNAEALHRSFGRLVQGKVTVLTNGFDEELSVRIDKGNNEAHDCDFVFAGEVYPWMLDLYLSALSVLRETGERLPVLHIYGTVDEELRSKVYERDLGCCVIFKGTVPYEDSLRILARAKSLLLLFVGHNEIFRQSVPSKMYAYLFARRPYLALVPDGDAARILEEVGGGMVVKSSDPGRVAREISSFLRLRESTAFAVERNEDHLAKYSWAALSRELDHVLRDDVARRGR